MSGRGGGSGRIKKRGMAESIVTKAAKSVAAKSPSNAIAAGAGTLTPSQAKKLTITGADKELRKHGYSITGTAPYDLKNKTANYKVKGPDGKERTMSSNEIKSILVKPKAPKAPKKVKQSARDF